MIARSPIYSLINSQIRKNISNGAGYQRLLGELKDEEMMSWFRGVTLIKLFVGGGPSSTKPNYK